MQRYFIGFDHVEDDQIWISGEDAHHISRVMRMKAGDSFIAVLPDGSSSQCKILQTAESKVFAKALGWKQEEKELPIKVAIGSGLPKGDKLEWIIQKGTELGAHTFIPFNAARSIVKWDPKKSEKKLVRWEKIAKEAAEQSHRTTVPGITPPVELMKLIETGLEYRFKVIAYEEEAKNGHSSKFASLLAKMTPGDSLLVIFGPEGGLTAEEVSILENNGFISVGLGPRILRTETAPLYVLSAISYHFELMR
ncbi:16S rRNA (uracil1498-N3)-methyltransferase [Bacillus oleivorans]|uniref:Ribosomal RNA small subunit methyltransferase E n=1 Tax=Bacillus oleivorans TaxID=1448271 RepID=A0A285CJV2_9BACI|nr:16S rRNA (uracil(1498)-N(3))-methyltransferase [Bacillus oleivorans]SNX67862.1 16S rRNA (uracil1498-N3)-methyltransferase [Bacillus oleivorans]